MRVLFKVATSSGKWGAYSEGETGEVPDDEAKKLIDAGYVVAIGNGAKVETASVEPKENAAARIGRAAGRKGK